ncbi:hypothetical protein SDC9_180870 [bioreactor metagenome]|uniref:Uncharacterized protein n=1 Tax=bioreactor metagenome TaxID=1076179 RepID=A0A645HBA8_9ZZZZ
MRTIEQTAAGRNRVLIARADAQKQIAWFLHAAGHGRDALHKRFAKRHRIIHGGGGAHVKYQRARVQRQLSARNLTPGNHFDQLLFRALRIFCFKRKNLNILIGRSGLLHDLNGVRLVGFDGNNPPGYARCAED